MRPADHLNRLAFWRRSAARSVVAGLCAIALIFLIGPVGAGASAIQSQPIVSGPAAVVTIGANHADRQHPCKRDAFAGSSSSCMVSGALAGLPTASVEHTPFAPAGQTLALP